MTRHPSSIFTPGPPPCNVSRILPQIHAGFSIGIRITNSPFAGSVRERFPGSVRMRHAHAPVFSALS